jgi:hypothetical protein
VAIEELYPAEGLLAVDSRSIFVGKVLLLGRIVGPSRGNGSPEDLLEGRICIILFVVLVQLLAEVIPTFLVGVRGTGKEVGGALRFIGAAGTGWVPVGLLLLEL